MEIRLSVFENRTPRRIFGPKKDEVTRQWRKLNDLNYQYSSQNIIRAMKSRRMRWAGHVAYTGEGKSVYRFLVRNREGKTGVDGSMILRWVLRELGGGGWGHGLD